MAVTRHLVRPTRGSSGPGRTSPPIWPCSDWGLPCHALLPAVRWALTPPFHPYPPCGGRSLLCGPFRRLTAPRRYLAVSPVELGLSSARPKTGRDRRLRHIPGLRIIPTSHRRRHPVAGEAGRVYEGLSGGMYRRPMKVETQPVTVATVRSEE